MKTPTKKQAERMYRKAEQKYYQICDTLQRAPDFPARKTLRKDLHKALDRALDRMEKAKATAVGAYPEVARQGVMISVDL